VLPFAWEHTPGVDKPHEAVFRAGEGLKPLKIDAVGDHGDLLGGHTDGDQVIPGGVGDGDDLGQGTALERVEDLTRPHAQAAAGDAEVEVVHDTHRRGADGRGLDGVRQAGLGLKTPGLTAGRPPQAPPSGGGV
jgi:hypothetical protein